MNNPLDLALNNLVGHCEAVVSGLGSTGLLSPEIWTNSHGFEIPYPHAITLGGEDRSEAHLQHIAEFLTNRPTASPTFVVDSYSNLDLKPLGFEIFFSVLWTMRKRGPVELATPDDFAIGEATTPEQLREFDLASAVGFGMEGAPMSYADDLLNDGRYRFLLGRSEDELVSGALTFNDGESAGIYTLFTLPHVRGRGYGDAIIRAALSNSPDLPAITNPSDMSNNLFSQLAFSEIGTRTVWVHWPR